MPSISVEAELSEILKHLASTVPDFSWRTERGLERQPFEADRDHPIVTTLAKHAETVLGRPPVIRGEPFWTDCALMQAAGIPVVLFGADGAGAHATTEWVDIDSVRPLTEVLVNTATGFCS